MFKSVSIPYSSLCGFTGSQRDLFIRQKQSNIGSYLDLLLRNNRIQSQTASFCRTSKSLLSPGSLPCAGNEKVGSFVTGKPLAQNAGWNWEEWGWGGAMLDQSSDMFTLQLRIFLRAWPSCWSSQAPEMWSDWKRGPSIYLLYFSSLLFSSRLSLPLLFSEVEVIVQLHLHHDDVLLVAPVLRVYCRCEILYVKVITNVLGTEIVWMSGTMLLTLAAESKSNLIGNPAQEYVISFFL